MTFSPYTIAFRAGVLVVNGLFAALLNYRERPRVLAALGVIVAVYAVLHVVRLRYNPHRVMSAVIFGFDYIAIAAFVALTGGFASDAFIVYFLAIAFVALSLGASWGALASVVSMVSYLLTTMGSGLAMEEWPHLLYRLLSLGLLALIAGLRAEKIHDRVEQLGREIGQERQLLRQLNTIQDINREISAEPGLDRVLQLLLRRALELLDGTHGAVALPDKLGRWVVRVQVNFPPSFIGYTVRPAVGALGRALETGAPVILNHYHERPEAIPELADLRVHAAIGLPVHLNNHLVGILALGTTGEGREFRESDLELVRMLADQAAVAIANAQLLEDSRRRAENLGILFEASQALTTSLERETLFEGIYNAASTVMSADAFFICLYEQAIDELNFAFMVDAGRRYPPQRSPLSNNPTSQVIRQRKAILANLAPGEYLNGAQTIGDNDRLTASILIVPLLVGDRIIGAMSVQSYAPMAYGSEELNMLTILANQAAIQLDNADLFETTRAMALTDNLTGLGNSRHFHEQLEREIARARRSERPLSLIMLDSDSLKGINDRYGHSAGNLHLLGIAGAIRNSTRLEDAASRYAGDEFMIILPETDTEEAELVAERIRYAISTTPLQLRANQDEKGKGEEEGERDREQGGEPLFTTVSIGIATFPRHGGDPDALIRAADSAMYRAKYMGKNCVAVHS